MILKGMGNLVIVDNEKAVVGILTEREILQYLALNKTIPNKQVKYILTQKFVKLTPDANILDAAKTMISKKARLIVFQVDRLAGIITASDMARAFLETDRHPPLEER